MSHFDEDFSADLTLQFESLPSGQLTLKDADGEGAARRPATLVKPEKP